MKSFKTYIQEKYGDFIKYTDKLPSKLYHVSNPAFRNDILNNGLIPQIGDSYLCHAEDYGIKKKDLTPVIFLKDTNDYDSTYDDDRWEINTKNLDKNCIFNDFDSDMKGCIIYTKPISKNDIKLIYKGTGN